MTFLETLSLDLSVIAFVLAIYIATVVTPGSTFLFMSRLSLRVRRIEGAGAAVGIAVATTGYVVLAMSGLAWLLDQARWLARAVQILGGLYLIFLGVQAWRASRENAEAAAVDSDSVQDRRDFWSGFRMGALVVWSNPKGVLFFVSLYAAAIPVDASLATKGVVLAGGTSIELIWNALVVTVLAGKKASLVYKRVAKWIERTIGTVLAFFGVRLILDRG